MQLKKKAEAEKAKTRKLDRSFLDGYEKSREWEQRTARDSAPHSPFSGRGSPSFAKDCTTRSTTLDSDSLDLFSKFRAELEDAPTPLSPPKPPRRVADHYELFAKIEGAEEPQESRRRRLESVKNRCRSGRAVLMDGDDLVGPRPQDFWFLREKLEEVDSARKKRSPRKGEKDDGRPQSGCLPWSSQGSDASWKLAASSGSSGFRQLASEEDKSSPQKATGRRGGPRSSLLTMDGSLHWSSEGSKTSQEKPQGTRTRMGEHAQCSGEPRPSLPKVGGESVAGSQPASPRFMVSPKRAEQRLREASESLRVLVFGSTALADQRCGTRTEVMILHKVWDKLDMDGDGGVEFAEFLKFFHRGGAETLPGMRCVNYLMGKVQTRVAASARLSCTIEDMIGLLWLKATEEDVAQMLTWFNEEMYQAGRIDTPPLLPEQMRHEILKNFQNVDWKGGKKVPFEAVVEASCVDEETLRGLGKTFAAQGRNANYLSENDLLQMLCPNGYRAHEDVTDLLDEEGHQIVYISNPHFTGWRYADAAAREKRGVG